jgi:imidazolonepropionase
MSGTLLVRGARQLLTLQGGAEPRRGLALQELGIIRDGAVLIDDGHIVEVGTSRRVENLALACGCQEIDATGRVVMPGFVDCHTHLFSGAPHLDASEEPASRAAEDIDEPHESMPGALRITSAKRLESRARQFIHGMVRHGTTTLGAGSGYGLDLRTELKILRVHEKLNGAPLDIASSFFASLTTPAALESFSGLLPVIRRRSLARFAGLCCNEQDPNLEQSRAYLEAARSLGFQLRVQAGLGPAAEAVRLAVGVGALSVDHLEDATRANLDLLASSNTMAVLMPGAAFRGNRRPAPARQLIDGSAAVALSTNFNPWRQPSYNMQTVVGLACAQLGMSPAEAICATTFNAACALGLGHVAGSLESGKMADLIVLNASDYREIPRYFGVNLVHRTIKRGVAIYQEGNVAR